VSWDARSAAAARRIAMFVGGDSTRSAHRWYTSYVVGIQHSMSLGTVGGHQHQARVARLESRDRGFRVADRDPASRHREQPDPPGLCALLRVRGSLRRSRTRCPLCACQEHKPRFPTGCDHSTPATVSSGTGAAWRGPQPELPGAVPALPSATGVTDTLEPVPANAPRQHHPGSPLPAIPSRGPSRAHTAPARARPGPAPGIPAGSGHPARLRPFSPPLAGHVNIRRPLLLPPWTPVASPGSAYRRLPSGLAASSAAAAGTATRKHIAAVQRIPGRQPAGLGRQRQRRIHHGSAAYQQVSLSVMASV
jgi:hypothetical protein